MKDFKVVRWFSCVFVAFIILFAGVVSSHAVGQKVSETVPVLPGNALLQFSAGGHILGFKPDKVYFASFDHAIIEEFVGTKGVMPVGEAGMAGKENPEGQPDRQKGAPALVKVAYKNLWQGITLKYEAKNGGIAESTYALEPGADVKNIKLKYNVSVDIEKDGSLRFRHPSENGYFSQSAPKAWQEIEGKRTPIEVSFADYGDNTFGFRLGQYNRQYPVIIDPTYQWHAFYGSAGIDFGNAIAVDAGGNVYVTGTSDATWGVPLNAFSGVSFNMVVLKLNSSGVYQWHTFYGSGAGNGIAVDAGGNVYVTGFSNATWGVPLNAHSGSSDIVVLKLNSNGVYQWHTFYGSAAGQDVGRGIAVDISGNVLVTGHSNVTWGSPLNAFSSFFLTLSNFNQIVVLKLNSNGIYQWHTFYGSDSGEDIGRGIAVDTAGNVHVTGYSDATWGTPLNAHSGSFDIVVLKLNSSGVHQWHTFYGSAFDDGGKGIAVDTAGNVYVTGYSNATWGTPLNAHSGNSDIVVLKLDSSGGRLWHTFYGSALEDVGYGIAVDLAGDLYVTGFSKATWGAPLNAHSGSSDIVAIKLSNSGTRLWHTFYGFAGNDFGNGIAVDIGGNVYVAGISDGDWGASLHAHSGSADIVVLKLGADTLACTYSISPTSQSFTSTGGTGFATVTASAGSCAWTASTALSWATMTTGSGMGSGPATFSVSANTTGATRTGNLTIAGQTFIITQSGGATANNCAASVSASLVVQIPIVTSTGLNYWLNLQYNSASSNLTEAGAGPISDMSPYSACTASTMSSGGLLHISVVMYNGVSYWLDLQYNAPAYVVAGFGQN